MCYLLLKQVSIPKGPTAIGPQSRFPNLSTPIPLDEQPGHEALEFHYCVIYFMAGISKLQGESWWAGEAVWRAAANYEYQSADLTWLAHVPWLINLVTHGTILWEISFCFLVWNPLLRPLILPCGVAMHLGIGGFLGMWTFGSAMIFGYLPFVSPPVTQRFLNPIVSLFPSRTRTLRIHNGHRTSLRRAARLLAFDFCQRVTIQFASDPPDTGDLNEFNADKMNALPRPDIAPLIVIYSRESATANSRLVDYLAKITAGGSRRLPNPV